MIVQNVQFNKLARYYDMIYNAKDYALEARKLREIIRKYKRTPGNTLLDVACGTGKHIQHLSKVFECTGIDCYSDMLRIARKNAPEARFIRAGMPEFDLKRRFDVVLCLFSSIGYARTNVNLKRTIACFSRHLEEGGVAIIEPWFTPDQWVNGYIYMETYNSQDTSLARLGYTRTWRGFSVLDEHVLIARKGGGIKHYADIQVLGLFDHQRVVEMMNAVGITSRYVTKSLSPKRGLIIGIKNLDKSRKGL